MTEVLIMVAIIAIVSSSFLGTAVLSLKLSSLAKETIEANSLAEDIIEGARNFRDGTDWGSDGLGVLTTDPYHLEKSLSTPFQWLMVVGEETVGQFTRKIIFEDVSRDSLTGEIETVYNSSNHDFDTKKAIATVSWDARSIEIIYYFTNWKQ